MCADEIKLSEFRQLAKGKYLADIYAGLSPLTATVPAVCGALGIEIYVDKQRDRRPLRAI